MTSRSTVCLLGVVIHWTISVASAFTTCSHCSAVITTVLIRPTVNSPTTRRRPTRETAEGIASCRDCPATGSSHIPTIGHPAGTIG